MIHTSNKNLKKFEKTENFDAPTVKLDNGTLDFVNTIKYSNIDEIKLNYKYFEIDAIVIPNVKSQSVKLVNKEDKGIKFDFKGFPSLAIWTKPNAPFVCLEPWIGRADNDGFKGTLEEKIGMEKLSAGESRTVSHTVEFHK